MSGEPYSDLDRRHVWHPYTKLSAADAGLPVIVRGEGIYLFDAEGNRYVDAISSWWACSLGHNHPRIVAAIQRQAGELQHSILGNLSHPGAIELASKLAALMPTPDRHVMFASDGASAVEAALKIALQYWHNTGQPARRRFAALEEAYHGDTLGAMSVGYLDQFHRPFDSIVFPVFRASPQDGFDSVRAKITAKTAAVIVEPLCQGAAGMKMYPPEYLRQLAELCRQKRVLLILDEIATGYGRTGKMFAFEHAGVDADIVCVGKAVTAGYLPLSATIVRDEIYRTFSDTPFGSSPQGRPEDRSFYHGHTFCGNPIAAAAALETLRVYEDERIVEKAAALGQLMRKAVEKLATRPQVREVRCLGAIAAVELKEVAVAQKIKHRLLAERILTRPLGRVVYLMPPLNTPEPIAAELVAKFATAINDSCSEN